MLENVAIVPLAAESLGTRSMCTYIATPDLKILFDAGVSLCPKRYKLPPHPQEFKVIKETRQKIAEYAEKADVITISHYHFDHHTPSFEDWLCNWTDTQIARQIYENKLVLAKNYRAHINPSQRRRGWIFQKTGGAHAKKLKFADGKKFIFGKTELKFSQPVFHGVANTPLGWVLLTTIEHDGEKVMFAPDVQGPMNDIALKVIMRGHPQLLIIGGPPLYLAGFRVDEQHLQKGLHNLEQLAKAIPVVIVEHHLLRDLNWRELTTPIFNTALSNGNRFVSAAEFLGKEDCLLEAKRRELFEEDPPGPEFKNWMKLPDREQRRIRPPD